MATAMPRANVTVNKGRAESELDFRSVYEIEFAHWKN
jgi:hypothetical protein